MCGDFSYFFSLFIYSFSLLQNVFCPTLLPQKRELEWTVENKQLHTGIGVNGLFICPSVSMQHSAVDRHSVLICAEAVLSERRLD